MFEAKARHIKSEKFQTIIDDPFHVIFHTWPTSGDKWFAYRTGGYIWEEVESVLVDDNEIVVSTKGKNVYELTKILPLQQ